MEERKARQRALEMARHTLALLEEQAAGYTVLTVPVSLINEIEAKRREIKRLEALLAGKSAETVPGTLPRREPFFGREAEIDRALDALSPEDRGWGLLIDGMGGIGKTALAVEVAYICQERGLFHVFLFTTAKQTRLGASGEQLILDAATTLDAMLSEIARALGEQSVAQLASVEKHRSMLEALRVFSGPERRVLLILDNLETFTPDEQTTLSYFLRRLPQHCKAIITSRRRTGEGGVWLRLGKLEWGGARQLIVDQMHRAPTLKRIMAQAGEARWRELYDAVGGSPLALQWMLGLMRVRCLSLDLALYRLRTGDAKESPLFQFIYREALQDMSANDQLVLGALSLFAAPATSTALTKVTDQSRLVVESVLERLQAFSVVNMQGAGDYYSLHPLTRHLATDELARQPGIVYDLRERFCQYWLEYAEEYGGEHKDAHKTFDYLEAEWPNLQSAAEILWEGSGLPGPLQDEEAARLLNDLALAVRTFLWARGYWDERVRLGERAYQAARALDDWWSAGWRAYEVAWIHQYRDDIDQASVWADRMAEAMERGGSLRDRATATRLCGLLAMRQGDLTEAEQLYHDARTAYEVVEDDKTVAIVLNDLGNLARKKAAYNQAVECYQEALVLAGKADDKNGQAVYIGNLGELALDWDRPTEAHRWFEKQLALAQEVGRPTLVAQAQAGLARALEEEGLYTEALPLAEEALRIREQLRDRNLDRTRRLVARLREKAGEESTP